MDPRATSLFPMLSVADLGRSLGFYRDVLGGEQTYRFPPDGEAAFVVLRLGSARRISASARWARPRRSTGGRFVRPPAIASSCASTSATSTKWSSRCQPSAHRWCWSRLPNRGGERIAYVEDPDGNLVMLAR